MSGLLERLGRKLPRTINIVDGNQALAMLQTVRNEIDEAALVLQTRRICPTSRSTNETSAMEVLQKSLNRTR